MLNHCLVHIKNIFTEILTQYFWWKTSGLSNLNYDLGDIKSTIALNINGIVSNGVSNEI